MKQFKSKFNGVVGDKEFIKGQIYSEAQVAECDPNDFEQIGDLEEGAEMGGTEGGKTSQEIGGDLEAAKQAEQDKIAEDAQKESDRLAAEANGSIAATDTTEGGEKKEEVSGAMVKHCITEADLEADATLTQKGLTVGDYIEIPLVEGAKTITVDEAYLDAKPDLKEKGIVLGDVLEDTLEEGGEVL